MSTAGLYDEDPLNITPQKHSQLMSINQHIAHSCSLSDDSSLEHSPQISPASVLPTHNESPLKACDIFEQLTACVWTLGHLSMPAKHAFCLSTTYITPIKASQSFSWKLRSMTMFRVLQTLLDRSLSIQDNSNPGDQAAEFLKLRHQHAQLLAFNHVLVEENNHRLVDHAELVSEVKFQTASLTTCASPETSSALSLHVILFPQ